MTRDCWKDFAHSGKVSDYLQYRKQEDESGSNSVSPAHSMRRPYENSTSDSVLGQVGQTLSGTVSEEKEEAWDRHSL